MVPLFAEIYMGKKIRQNLTPLLVFSFYTSPPLHICKNYKIIFIENSGGLSAPLV